MSKVVKLPNVETETGEACTWLARMERGLTREEERELRAWMDEKPGNTGSLLQAASLWDRMDTLARLADLFPKPEPRARRPRMTFALAASAILALAAGVYAWVTHTTAGPPDRLLNVAADYQQVFETAIGEHSTILLPDGTELTLNTNSRVRAFFSERGRQLRLERGEVYVRVAHDESRPLTVWAEDRIVRAVGTAFNVEIKADQHVEVIVAEGKVVIGLTGPGGEHEPAWLERIATPVVAGERAVLGDSEPKIERIDAESIDVKLSWRDGNLVFRGEPLAEALGEIGRYTRVEFIIRDEALKSIRVAGLFRAGDVEGLLTTLHQNFNIAYERVDPETIMLKSE